MSGPHEGWASRPSAHQPAVPPMRPDTPYDLGIDLGTTFTAAAVRAEARPGAPEPGVRVVGLERGAVQVPSVLLVDDDGSLLVGSDAEDRAPGAPHRVVREFKRRLGDDTPIVVGGESFSADGVAAEMVRWTADRVAESHGAGPRRIAVAHPAGWGAYRRRVFTEALAEVGLHDVVLLTEPEAAAAAHAASGRLPLGRTVAVYDLGGGTFDAAVVRGVHPTPVAPVGLTVLGRGQGIEALGGIDFDEALFWHVCSGLGGAVDALDPADPATVRAVAGLRRACVAAKETLSVDTEAVVDVRLPDVTTRVRVTRGEFEEMISPALRQTVDVLGEVLDSARVSARDLDGVLLVGGSSRIPLVAQLLSAELGRPVAVDPDPTTVVARGATWAAAAASGAVRPAAPASGPFRAPSSIPFPTPGRGVPTTPDRGFATPGRGVPTTPGRGFATPGSGPLPALVPAPGSASFGTPGSGPFAAPVPGPIVDGSPRTDVVGRPAPLGRTPDVDPLTAPVGPALRSVPGTHVREPVTSPLRIPAVASARPAGVPSALPGSAGLLEPPHKPDPRRRRRLAIGASVAAALVVAGGVAVAVPMITTSNSTATLAAPAPGAPAGITAQPAAADAGTLPAGTLPAGTLPAGTDPTTSESTSRSRTPQVANKAATEAAAPAPRPAAVATPVVPAAAAPVVPAAPAPAATTPAPVVTPLASSTTPTTTGSDTPKSGTGTGTGTGGTGTGAGNGSGSTTTTPPAGTAAAASGPTA